MRSPSSIQPRGHILYTRATWAVGTLICTWPITSALHDERYAFSSSLQKRTYPSSNLARRKAFRFRGFHSSNTSWFITLNSYLSSYSLYHDYSYPMVLSLAKIIVRCSFARIPSSSVDLPSLSFQVTLICISQLLLEIHVEFGTYGLFDVISTGKGMDSKRNR